jgi:predicted glycoside hydrolase/deacetylase ChbG (UPF0249 family)
MAFRLIINADDYGRDDDVSRGIREAHTNGIVTSTTAMMNMPASATNLRQAALETPGLGLGVHLVLTSGKPLLPAESVSSLVDEHGSFLRPDALIAQLDSLKPGEVMAEWRAQVHKFIQVTGRAPTHLDSHHHASYFSRMLFRSMLMLAKEVDCAIRILGAGTPEEDDGLSPRLRNSYAGFSVSLLVEFHPPAPDYFNATFYDDQATPSNLMEILQNLKQGVTELMCHPGYAGAELISASIYNHQRESELEILTDPDVKQAIESRGIRLSTFADLAVE